MTLNNLDTHAFADTDREAWLALVGKALKGADFTRALVSATDDGIAIQPLYDRMVDAIPLVRRRPLAPWTISQRMDDPDAARAQAQLADDIDNGATGISVVLNDSAPAFGIGLGPNADMRDVTARLAASIAGQPISVRLEAGKQSTAIADGLLQALGDNAPQTLHLGIDPFSPAAISGRPVDMADLGARFRHLHASALPATVFNADGRMIHNAGGTEAEELAVMAAAIAAYLRVLEAEGIALDAVLGAVSLCLCADQDQFVTMAKARAARLIFARIAEACGVDPALQPHLFMETSYRMLTLRDPETNILRNTIAVFAAGTGGADEITVLPHTLAHGIPDPLARRLARNTQHVLMAESHLDHVADPAAGAGGIEALTEGLAARAWGIFADIERGGGLGAMIEDGLLAAMIAGSQKKRPSGLIVGTSLFAAEGERPVAVLGPLGALPVAGLRAVRRDEEIA